MTVVDQIDTAPRHLRARAGWPLWVLLVGYPVLWLLGIAPFAWMAIGVLLLAHLLIRRGPIEVPRGFGWWMAFLAVAVVSVLRVDGIDRVMAWGYRGALYMAATACFLYVYNLPADVVSRRRIVGMLVTLFVSVVIGGWIGIFFPRLSFPGLLTGFLPQGAVRDPFIQALTSVRFAQVQRILGTPIGRPQALFPYTNAWGSTLAILLPSAIAWLAAGWGSVRRQLLVSAVVLAAIVPAIISLNRGLWLSAGVAIGYVVLRLAGRGRFLAMAGIVAAVGMLVLVLALSPLGGLFTQRSTNAHSDEGRTSLITQSIERGFESPIIGFGSPQARADKDDGPLVGTHGHLWLTMVSQGLLGAGLFVGWWVGCLRRTYRQSTVSGLWLHTTLVVGVTQMPFYELLPAQLPILMIVAALLLRAEPDDAIATVDDRAEASDGRDLVALPA